MRELLQRRKMPLMIWGYLTVVVLVLGLVLPAIYGLRVSYQAWWLLIGALVVALALPFLMLVVAHELLERWHLRRVVEIWIDEARDRDS